MGATATAALGDPGDGDRLAGGDLRGLLADPAGGAARLSLTHPHRAHLRAGVRPDLYSGHQLDALYLGGDRHHELRALQQPGGGLRHRRHRHHGAHLHPLLLGGSPQLALEQVPGGRPVYRAAGHRRAALCRQPRQDLLRRLAAAHPGGGDVHRDDQLEERALSAYSSPQRARQFAGANDRLAGKIPADPGGRHCGLYVAGGQRDPHALLHNLKHNKVLHERIILLTLRVEEVPYVHNVRRVCIEQLSPPSGGWWQATAGARPPTWRRSSTAATPRG